MDIIKLQNISNHYRIRYEKSSLIGNIFGLITHQYTVSDIWALQDINLAIPEGKTYGIIGDNGAGKSTLLGVMAGIITPEKGNMIINGKISSLIELLAGFYPEFTGEENIYTIGALLGLTRNETKKKMNKIIEFAEIGDFINAKIATYSTGMLLRLGFSIAINTDFDILLVDEIISVGDAYFQKKCYKRIKDFKQQGKTIIIASHSHDSLRKLCDKTIYMDKGQIRMIDLPIKTINLYYHDRGMLSPFEKKEIEKQRFEEEKRLAEEKRKQEKTRRLEEIKRDPKAIWKYPREPVITKVQILGKNNRPKKRFKTHDKMIIKIEFQSKIKLIKPVIGLGIFSKDDAYLIGPNTKFYNINIPSIEGKGYAMYTIYSLPFLKGDYFISICVSDYSILKHIDYHDKKYSFKVTNSYKANYGSIFIKGKWQIHQINN